LNGEVGPTCHYCTQLPNDPALFGPKIEPEVTQHPHVLPFCSEDRP
jgi:hypothetical protein